MEWVKIDDYCRGRYTQVVFDNGGGHGWIELEATNKPNDYNVENWDIFGDSQDLHTVSRQTINIDKFLKLVDQIPEKVKEWYAEKAG